MLRRSETIRPSAADQNPRSGHRVALATRLRAVCDDEIVPPAVLQNLRRLRLATVLPNRNGCDSELARLKTHAIGFRKPCARARLAKFRVLGIEWHCPPGLGRAVPVRVSFRTQTARFCR